MNDLKQYEVWFVAGSQDLYGAETLAKVAANSKTIAQALDAAPRMPVRVVFKAVLTTPDAIKNLCLEANAAAKCVGLVAWMHTFSPAKMWIAGLRILAKPYVHLHTQFNREIPWATIDMDFMNLNQAAHGDREFGFICTRLRQNRKVIAGPWEDEGVRAALDVWARAACAWHDAQGGKIARIGDNMREVAVTEGDKVEAQIRLGYAVNGYSVGDVLRYIDAVTDAEIDALCAEYDARYEVAPALRPQGERRAALRYAARTELGLRAFLTEGGFKGFTDTFENLQGLKQLPGIAVQRLMAAGYGFGAEGDWKQAALVRAMKVMATGLPGGTSFMEDYTYHFHPGGASVLGAHMLEICESVAAGKPSCEIHPLGIGGKDDPVRLVFNSRTGPAVNATVIDLGNRFRMVVNTVDVMAPPAPLPKLPVARAVWVPRPDLQTAATAWILAGGAHHTGYSLAIGAAHLEDFAAMADIEFVAIDDGTRLSAFKKELRWNELYYHLARGL
ncbi:MAG TPA: L-arabinose isomerase [Planctomycetota bacterium]|jgi:L-arabinose isomerase|nr:L-arabinose isomerase [Planctomycetota bacterium]OQC21655.1 MAG: L-arabinose isomerase [Planctomycetes bacterium ADurb.Bin069]HNS00690.1 L-arabinose isomerase [Planctomycetota bacterium]HOE29624.1 L-arabinose isomerase [Planctomycetota bacterium]HOE87355.1 L-arabinose isomerase [Planctomycetota bacterium]